MSNRPTTFDDHDPLAHDILDVLEDFIDEIGARECTAHFDSVVDGKYLLKGKNLIQTPERFTEEHLVFPHSSLAKTDSYILIWDYFLRY